jgi:hypothetical protein
VAARWVRHRQWTGRFYHAAAAEVGTPFWTRRQLDHGETPTAVPSQHNRLPSPDQPLQVADAVRITTTPCIIGDRVAPRLVIDRPSWSEPVLRVGNIELAALVRHIRHGSTASGLVHSWLEVLGPEDAPATLSWMWTHHVLEPAVPQLPPA